MKHGQFARRFGRRAASLNISQMRRNAPDVLLQEMLTDPRLWVTQRLESRTAPAADHSVQQHWHQEPSQEVGERK